MEPEVRAVAWRVTHEPGKPLLDRNFDNVGDRITVVGSNTIGGLLDLGFFSGADRIAVVGANAAGKQLLDLDFPDSSVRHMALEFKW